MEVRQIHFGCRSVLVQHPIINQTLNDIKEGVVSNLALLAALKDCLSGC